MKKSIKNLVIIILIVLIVLLAFLLYLGHLYHDGTERIHESQIIPEFITEPEIIEKREADWPSWRGPDCNGKSNTKNIKKDWTSGLKKVWEVDYLCQGKRSVTWSAPVIKGNRLVVMGRDNKNDLVFCLNADNGELIWNNFYAGKVKNYHHGIGPRATPFIDEDRVYTFGRSGDLACWQLLDGKLLWKKNIYENGGDSPMYGDSSSPIVYNNEVIVQGGGVSIASAYNKMTGELLWKAEEGITGYASPVILKNTNELSLLIFYGNGIARLNPEDGKTIWSVPWKTFNNNNACTPVAEGNYIFITSLYLGCQMLKTKGKEVEILWTNKTIASFHSDAIIHNGYIYTYTGESSQNRGDFKCVELETGKEVWSTGKAGWGTVVFVDGYLLCMDIKGNLYLIEPSPDEFRIVTEFKNSLGKIKTPAWTIPVIANGKMYIRYLHNLVCYDLT
ncbi:MAG: PQQ-like beta-propeller repeat protein [Spirochaetales bacterium]|nr:PQQ-like beta-propeller repeat protein [Spirochaetales bacterium]